MSNARMVLPGSQWQVHDEEVEGLVDRLLAAASSSAAMPVRVLDDDGQEAVLVVAPGAVPVVVTGALRQQAPAQSFPQHVIDAVP